MIINNSPNEAPKKVRLVRRDGAGNTQKEITVSAHRWLRALSVLDRMMPAYYLLEIEHLDNNPIHKTNKFYWLEKGAATIFRHILQEYHNVEVIEKDSGVTEIHGKAIGFCIMRGLLLRVNTDTKARIHMMPKTFGETFAKIIMYSGCMSAAILSDAAKAERILKEGIQK